jgi:hypothetical protein
VIRSSDYLKQLSKLHVEVIEKHQTHSCYQSTQLSVNPNLLQLVFSHFTDLIAIKWEETADCLLDELLDEVVKRLNSLDSQQCVPSAYHPANCAELLALIEEVKTAETRLQGKYYRGSPK